MKAPLPEVPPHVPKKRDFAKAPLRSLSCLCAAKVAITLGYLLFPTPDPEMSALFNWSLNAVFALMSLLLIYGLWRGFGLARGLWLWISVLILPLYFYNDEKIPVSLGATIITWIDFGVTLSSIIYLNLPAVKAHFARREVRSQVEPETVWSETA